MNKGPERTVRKIGLNETKVAIAFVLPACIVVAGVLIFPALFNLNIAVRSWSWFDPPSQRGYFIGLSNFSNLLSKSNPRFWNSMFVTVFFMVIAVSIEFFLGLYIGVLLNKVVMGKRFFRSVCLIPMMIAPIVVGLQWTYLLSDNFGVINYILSKFHIPNYCWLSRPGLALFSVAAVDIWRSTPFVALMILGGLQTIPQELYEVAQIDGASSFQQFINVTVPFLKPMFILILLIRTIDVFKTFDLIYILTGGGPARRTEILGLYAYQMAFSRGEFGIAAALAVIILLIAITIGIFLLNIIKTEVKII